MTLDLHRIIETCTKVEIKDVYYSQSAFLTAFNFYRRLLSNINYAIKLIAVSLSAVVSSSHANYQTTKSIFHKIHAATLPHCQTPKVLYVLLRAMLYCATCPQKPSLSYPLNNTPYEKLSILHYLPSIVVAEHESQYS